MKEPTMIDGIIAAYVVAGKIKPPPPLLPWRTLARRLGSALVLVAMLLGGLLLVYGLAG